MRRDGGSSVSVALLPALGEPPSSLAGLAERLASRGLSVMTIPRVTRSDLGEHVADALAAIEEARQRRVLLVGASYGGMVACALAAEQERLREQGALREPRVVVGLVLLDSPHPLSHAVVRAYVGTRAHQLVANPEGVDLEHSLAWLRRQCPPGCLKSLPVTVLARGPGMWPGEDPALPAADRVWLAHQQLHGLLSVNAEVSRLPGVGHAVAVEAPDVVVAAVMRMAEGLSK
jgi:pimeloyl-ACP methyl ester carboxylesterase